MRDAFAEFKADIETSTSPEPGHTVHARATRRPPRSPPSIAATPTPDRRPPKRPLDSDPAVE